MDDKLITDKIKSIKDKHGDKLIILTHHYQRKEIVELGDFSGDSFALSQMAASCEASQLMAVTGQKRSSDSKADPPAVIPSRSRSRHRRELSLR